MSIRILSYLVRKRLARFLNIEEEAEPAVEFDESPPAVGACPNSVAAASSDETSDDPDEGVLYSSSESCRRWFRRRCAGRLTKPSED